MVSVATNTNYDLRKILAPYQKKWVALSPNHRKVLADGRTLKSVRSKTKNQEAVFIRVLPADTQYVPVTW